MSNVTRMDILQQSKKLYRANGLPFPPIPAELAQQVMRISEWVYGTRADVSSPYLTEAYFRELNEGVEKDYVVFGHAGHGITSYGLHFHLVWGPLALFLQHAWGNADSDPVKDAETIARDYALADQIIRAAQQAESFRLPQRLVVYHSNLRLDSRWALLTPDSGDLVWNYPGFGQALTTALDLIGRKT
jgi:hypothetical protein